MQGRTSLAAAAAALILSAPAAGAVLEPAVIDTAPLDTTGLAMAPDGTGALVYTKTVGADDQVWVSTLDGATWSAPQRVDPDNGDDEDAPRIAVGNGGRVLVGYRDNAGTVLKWRLRPQAGAAFTPEDAIYTNMLQLGSDWDLDMNPAGVAYAGFSQLDSGTMLRNLRAWRLEGLTDVSSLKLQPYPNATSVNDSANGPDVRVAVDGAGGGGLLFGHDGDDLLYQPLTGVTGGPSVDVEVPSVLGELIDPMDTAHQLELDMTGAGVAWTAGSAMYPNGGHAVGRRVDGAVPGPATTFDLHPASENDNAERPDVALAPDGGGVFATEPNQRAGMWGGVLGGAPQRVDVAPIEPAGTENPAAAAADGGRGLVAWTRDVADGNAGPFEVRGRPLTGGAFGPEVLLSAPALGAARIPSATSSADAAGATRLGDTAVLMEQDNGTKRVVVGRYDAPPSTPGILAAGAAGVSWSAAEALWSPLTGYRVLLDEQPVATVGAGTTSFAAGAIAPGAHTWRVVALDGAGNEAASAAAGFTVPAPPATPQPGSQTRPRDRTTPKGSLSIKRRGRRITFRIRASDASGIRSITLSFGRKGVKAIRRTKAFTLTKRLKPGRYKLVLTIRDRAGNTKVVRRTLRVR